MKYLITLLLLVAPVFADDPEPGFYRAYDGIFIGTGTGFGTEADLLRDLGLDLIELSTLDMPGWTVHNETMSATVSDIWSGLWSYQNDPILPDVLIVGVDGDWAAYCLRSAEWSPCQVGTVEISGNWSTDDLGGRRIDHLSVFQSRIPMNTTCDVPEPCAVVLALVGMVLIGSVITLLHAE